MLKKSFILVLVLMAAVLVLAACAAEPQVVEVTRVVTEVQTEVVEGEGEVVTVEVEVTREVVVTEEVEVVVEATPVPVDRNGGWLDTIAFVREPDANAAVSRLIAGDIDMYPSGLPAPSAAQAAADAGTINLVNQYGLYYEIFFNVTDACADGSFNPFQNAKIREAMNWAVDRDYVASEIYGGNAVPKYTAFSEAGVDRGAFAPDIRAIEAKYAYNLEQAREVVTAEMEGMGAELVDGVWTFEGAPIVLINLIRSEAPPRTEKGNYFATQLEALGFQVERRIGTASDLGSLWTGEPTECAWHTYTGGWSQTVISRDDASSFNQFYLPEGYPLPAWQIFQVPERMSEIINRLVNSDFANLEERAELFREVLPLTLEQSYRIWVVSQITPIPYNDDVAVTADLASGIQGSLLWARTARFVDEVGGTMTVATQDMFVEPWNPIGGSNWVFDAMVKNAISEPALYAHPNLGINVPNRIEKAELVVQEGTNINLDETTDWLELSFAPEIEVPGDAWAAWDAENQVFLTADEVYTETQTAAYKSTVYYPSGFGGTTWHDGSPFSPADIVMTMITRFDVPNETSPYYDAAEAPRFEQFVATFKGVKIISTDPLVIEHYGDDVQLDAENSVVSWWPYSTYPYGDAAWHNMAQILRLQANGSTAIHTGTATENEIERVSLLSGPSIALIGAELALSAEEGFIPYAATLGQFITAEEAAERYANLATFGQRYSNYNIGTGPYFLQGVFPTEKQAILKHFDAYPDSADRFSQFSAPATAVVEIDGDTRVTIGQEASFDVYVDYYLGAYAVDDIKSVTYLLFDATGALAAQGEAEAVEDGLWQVVLDGETTGLLSEGSSRLEVVVVSKLTALPGLAQFPFVAAP
ncbi:MAG: ABC transporter substrate-binding protein [Chloroflexota bacterium]